MNVPLNVNQTVLDDLCTCCGACVAVCPVKVIQMVETGGGLLVPQINEEDCTYCGLCRQVCAGDSLKGNLHEMDNGPFMGPVLETFIGHAKDEALRLHGQSGGIVSTLLIYMLAKGLIDYALITKMPKDGTLRPIPFWANSPNEVFEGSGSKYCPVPLLSIINELPKGAKYAVVGLACHVQGIKNIQEYNKKLIKDPTLIIGLFCDRILSFRAIDHLKIRSRLNPQDIKYFEFKNKERSGWPGDVCFTTSDGEKHFFDKKERMRIKNYYTPPRCRLCFDKMNVFSDLSLGDAHGFKPTYNGLSSIIVRTRKGQQILHDAVEDNILEIEKVPSVEIFEGQGIDSKKREWLSFMAIWSDLGYKLPQYKMPEFKTKITSDYVKLKKNIKWSLKMAHAVSGGKIVKLTLNRQKLGYMKEKLRELTARLFSI